MTKPRSSRPMLDLMSLSNYMTTELLIFSEQSDFSYIHCCIYLEQHRMVLGVCEWWVVLAGDDTFTGTDPPLVLSGLGGSALLACSLMQKQEAVITQAFICTFPARASI